MCPRRPPRRPQPTAARAVLLAAAAALAGAPVAAYAQHAQHAVPSYAPSYAPSSAPRASVPAVPVQAADAVLFATDFSGDAPGDFPAGFSLGRGTFEVAEYEGRRVLRATTFGDIHLELPHELPVRFTLELEVAAREGWTQEVHFKSMPQAYVRYGPDHGGIGGRPPARARAGSNAGTGRFFTVRVLVDGPAVKVHHGSTLVANVPRAELGRSNRITFRSAASTDHPAYIASVRLTSEGAAAPPASGDPGTPAPTPTPAPPAPPVGGAPGSSGSRFDMAAVGALDAAFAGPATYARAGATHTITLASAAGDGQEVVLTILDEGLRTQEPYVVQPPTAGRTRIAQATGWLRAEGSMYLFAGTSGTVSLTRVGPGRVEGRVEFAGRTESGAETLFRGSFDARQSLSAPAAPAPATSVATITTTLATAVGTPAAGAPSGGTPRSMYELQRTPNGGYVLQPGHYAYDAQSYSLSAGGPAPGGADGYLLAPLAGPAEDAVATVLRNSVNHPELARADVQRLLWGVVLGLRAEEMPAPLRTLAARLLTPRQLERLNRCPADAPACLPAPNAAESRLRALLADGASTMAALEAAAFGAAAGTAAGSRTIARGQWIAHPDGYAVRYLPQSYGRTTVELWVSPGNPSVGREFDPATHVAVPGDAAGHRLALSGRGAS